MGTPIEPKYMALLANLELDQFPHLHGSAQDHLIGVYNLLAEWGNPLPVCLAGLLHNIYGTEVFKPKAVTLARRTHIAEVIGSEAEELVFLFCVCKRIGFFDDSVDSARPILWDEVHRQKIVTTPVRMAALIEIEIANAIEQYSPELGLNTQELDYLMQTAEWMYQKAASKVSAKALSALQDVIGFLLRDVRMLAA